MAVHESERKGTKQVVGDYLLCEQLGQGGFGSVVKGVHIETGEVTAVKFVPKRSFRQFSDLQRVFQEMLCLRNLRHPNVIRILDVADHPDNVVFVMEFAGGGELRAHVERCGKLEEDEARVFFKQIVRAVHYIHTKFIIHRDLKLENILLDSEQRCKIVDFGLSDYVSSKEKTVTDAGTEAYLAPEVFNGSSGHSDPYKLDVWGLGVILYAMAHGRLPFSRPDRETCQRIEAEGLQMREGLSEEYKAIVKVMLTTHPSKRAPVSTISLDPWLNTNRFPVSECDEGDDECAPTSDTGEHAPVPEPECPGKSGAEEPACNEHLLTPPPALPAEGAEAGPDCQSNAQEAAKATELSPQRPPRGPVRTPRGNGSVGPNSARRTPGEYKSGDAPRKPSTTPRDSSHSRRNRTNTT